jgi:hypothetical protein
VKDPPVPIDVLTQELVEEEEAKKLLLAIPSGEKEHCRGYPGWGQLSWNQRLYVARNPGDPEIKAKIAALLAGASVRVERREALPEGTQRFGRHFQLTAETRALLNARLSEGKILNTENMAQTKGYKYNRSSSEQTKHPATQMKSQNIQMLELIIAGRPREALEVLLSTGFPVDANCVHHWRDTSPMFGTHSNREPGEMSSSAYSALTLAAKFAGEVKDKAGVREDAVELVKTLLEKGADPNFEDTEVYSGGSWTDTISHPTPLIMAKRHRDDEVEALLLEHGAILSDVTYAPFYGA